MEKYKENIKYQDVLDKLDDLKDLTTPLLEHLYMLMLNGE